MKQDPPVEEGRRPGGPERAVAAAALGLIFFISIANTVVRYATSVSFAFTEEFSVALLVVMTLAGTAAAFAAGGNIAMTFLRDQLPRRARRACGAVAAAASVLMFGLIAWYGGRLAYEEWFWEETSAGLGYPSWIYTIWLPLLSLVILARILQSGARARRDAASRAR